MAEYNRFVSYVYTYENNQKSLNNGFARVETKDDKCYIYIHMKDLYGDSHTRFKVYVVKRREQKLLGIYLGDMQRNGNEGEFSRQTAKDNIEDSGLTLTDMAGIVVIGERGRKYGTCWDDDLLDMRSFIPAEEAENDEHTKREDRDKVHEAEAPQAAEPEKSEPRLLTAEELDQESSVKLYEEHPDKEEPIKEDPVQEALPVEELPEEVLEDNSKEQAVLCTVPKPHAEAPEIQNALKDAEAESEVKPDKVKIQADDSVTASDGLESGEPDYSGLMAESVHSNTRSEKASIQQRLDKLIRNGLKMYPFEDDEMDGCIRMELQDIGMLPMKFWVYASNSFLLHSYYSYRHLILARRRDGSYILGVPGLGQKKDSFMAQMFGFDNFKTLRSQGDKAGDFGYWYVKLS